MSHLKSTENNFLASRQIFKVFKKGKELLWDDFEKSPALELLKKIHHKTFQSIFFGPCQNGILISELKLLWPDAQIDCFDISTQDRIRRRRLDTSINWLYGSLESVFQKKYDLILIPSGFNTVSNHKRNLRQWLSCLNKKGTLAMSCFSDLRTNVLEPIDQALKESSWMGITKKMIDLLEHFSKPSKEYLEEIIGDSLSDLNITTVVDEYQLEFIYLGQRILDKWGISEYLLQGVSNNHDTILNRFWFRYAELLGMKYVNMTSRMMNFPVPRLFITGTR
jgi:trans-aconitate methyltransferase